MAVIEIVEFPHPVLKEIARPVEAMNPELMKFIEDMAETMYNAPGVGLAANQVGLARQIAVVDVSNAEEPKNTLVLVNPRIIEWSEQTEAEEEGCLSVPELRSEVKRALMITVLAKNLQGDEIKLRAEGFLARVLQHEIDHLNGTLFIDRIGKFKRQRYVRQRKKALAAAEKE